MKNLILINTLKMTILAFAMGVMAVEVSAADAKPSGVVDGSTKVYSDALWLRVHAEDCPTLILKDKKKTMTLEEADKAGYRLGEGGQSGRGNCCLPGYKRKHPEKTISDDTILCGNDLQKNVKHLAGCHRYFPSSTDKRQTKKEWIAGGFTVCGHCVERGPRGPSVAAISDEEWAKLGPPQPFVAPAGWVPKPYSIEKLPAKEEVDILIQETLNRSKDLRELPFTDPIARMEHFMIIRFFFGGYTDYKLYRSTGDKRLLDKLLESARHFHDLSVEFPSVAQLKARDPEGMPFLFSMAACARITLQLALKHPGEVSKKDIEEAEAFLKTMLSVLEPTCEGNDALDPDMGIPKKLADDFRARAFNRAMNGIGTLSMMTAALADLQTLRKTKEYQPRIDRYRKVIQAYIKFWFNRGHFCTKIDGEKHFVYPYATSEAGDRMVDGCKIFKRTEDAGHYSHTLQGVMCLYESTPELGIDDDFMTAVANAVYRSSTVKVQIGKKSTHSGHIECITAAMRHPHISKSHTYSPARERFYMLEAFRKGIIDAQCITLNEANKFAANSEYEKRIETLFSHYLKALRNNRSIIHLGEKL